MKAYTVACLWAGVVVAVGTSRADDVNWLGINNIAGTATDTDINSGALWSDGVVPDNSDTARLIWDQTATAKWGNLWVDGAFDPGSMVVQATADAHPHVSTEAQLQIRKSLELGKLTLNFGYQQTGGDANVLVVAGNILTLTDTVPLGFGGHRGCWASLSLQAGTSLIFPGPAHTFNVYNTNYAHNSNKAQGFRALGGVNGFVDFTGVGATITLGDISGYNQRYYLWYAPPCMDLGYNALRVRSDQTWTNSSSGTGVIRVNVARSELVPTAQHNILVQSVSPDGLLPDLSQVPFRIDRTDKEGNASTYYIPGASYQSLHLYSSGHNWTHGAQTYFTGDVNLGGGTLTVLVNGEYAAGVEQTQTSLHIHNGARAQRVYFNGHRATMARGMRIQADSDSNWSEITYVDVTGATLDIGGSLTITAATTLRADGATPTRLVGLYGNASTVITLRGNFVSTLRSPDGDNLRRSTVNMLAGSPGATNSFEVAADPDDGVAGLTYAIGTFNVGTSVTATAYVRLVNNYLNDQSTLSKEGEVLLAGALNIGPGSTLDLNANGVKVGSTLAIDATGTLALNTGRTLSDFENVPEFVGVGDQTAVWETFAGRVVDSANPDFSFEPVFSAGLTYWRAIPPPSGTLILLR